MENKGENLPAKREEKHDAEEAKTSLEISETNPIYFVTLDENKRNAYFIDSNRHYWVYDFNFNTFTQKQEVDLGLSPKGERGLDALLETSEKFKKFTSAENAMLYGKKLDLLESQKVFKDSSEDPNMTEGIRKRGEVVAERYTKLLKIVDELLEEKDPIKREELKKQYEEGYKNLAAY